MYYISFGFRLVKGTTPYSDSPWRNQILVVIDTGNFWLEKNPDSSTLLSMGSGERALYENISYTSISNYSQVGEMQVTYKKPYYPKNLLEPEFPNGIIELSNILGFHSVMPLCNKDERVIILEHPDSEITSSFWRLEILCRKKRKCIKLYAF